MNKRHLLYLLLILLVPYLCYADSGADNMFATANSLYAKRQFKQAQNVYQQLINKEYQSEALYYNMGNASYKAGDIALALLYYEKARKISPGDEAINFNISLANSKTVDRADHAPELFLSRWWHSVLLAISGSALAVISILLFLMASGSLILYFYAESFKVKKYSFFTAVTLFVLGIIGIIITSGQANYFNSHKEAVVFESAAAVKNLPASRAATVFEIHSGTKVRIISGNNSWLKIRLLNGHEGWIRADDVKKI